MGLASLMNNNNMALMNTNLLQQQQQQMVPVNMSAFGMNNMYQSFATNNNNNNNGNNVCFQSFVQPNVQVQQQMLMTQNMSTIVQQPRPPQQFVFVMNDGKSSQSNNVQNNIQM